MLVNIKVLFKRFDENLRNMKSLEWLVEDSEDVVAYGLMVRELGPATGTLSKVQHLMFAINHSYLMGIDSIVRTKTVGRKCWASRNTDCPFVLRMRG